MSTPRSLNYASSAADRDCTPVALTTWPAHELHPTPLPAIDRVACPTGQRSEAPPPTCTGRLAADYWLRIVELEAAARSRLAAEGWPYLETLARGGVR